MWSELPFDLLANIFSYLPPDSLARAKATCRNWRTTSELATSSTTRHRHPPWFIAFPARSWSLNSCYAHNPNGDNWHLLRLEHTICPIKPIATIGGLILSKLTATTTASLQLAISNPFTKQFRTLPPLNVARTNPAVGVVQNNNPPSSSKSIPIINETNYMNISSPSNTILPRTSQNSSKMDFKIYVAGGMSEAANGGSGGVYQPTVEIYDSLLGRWEIVGSPMPVEIAVRLTVWTPNESVYSNGTLYWMTSARAYSVMGFETSKKRWKELSVPMANRLEFAALVPRNGKVAVVGGGGGCGAWIWELREDDEWGVVGEVPFEFGFRLLGEGRLSCGGVKCVGIDGAICLYRDVGSGIVVWREVFGDEGKWEWDWIEGSSTIGGKEIGNMAIKGLLIHPNLARSTFPSLQSSK